MSNKEMKDKETKDNNNKTTWIQIRCTPLEKSAIVRQLKGNEKLSKFMLDAAAQKIERRVRGEE